MGKGRSGCRRFVAVGLKLFAGVVVVGGRVGGLSTTRGEHLIEEVRLEKFC